MQKLPNKYLVCGIYLFLTIITLAVFGQICRHDFVDYDDGQYVTRNDHVKNGFSIGSIKWAFTEPHVANWHPLTSMSHMLDCELFGLNPFGHHLVSLLLHVINTLLLFAILKKITRKIWLSAIVALIFAIHPLRMESVAWVSERKDVLSGMFWMLTMYAYVRYAQVPGTKRYIPVVLFFVLGLMSKPMVITLPFVLLLMDYWPLNRLKVGKQAELKVKNKEPGDEIKKFSAGTLILEKVPLFLLMIASSIVTFIFQRWGGGINNFETWPLRERLSNAAVSYVRYIGKIFYPAKLTPFYPHPGNSLALWQVILAVMILLAITFIVIRMRRTRPYLLIGWLWFLGTMVPVIGLIQVGSQAMADRYTYIPSIGLYIAVVWLVAELTKNNRIMKVTASVLTALIIVSLMLSTFWQLQYWKNNETLFTHAIDINENNYIMQNNYGNFLLGKGQYEQAIKHFSKAIEIKKNYALARENLARAYNDLAVALQKENKIDLAMKNWHAALAMDPNHSKANYNVGLIMCQQGKYDQAINCFKKVLKSQPDWYKPYNDIALAYEQMGKQDLAIENYKESIRLKPDYMNAQYNLGCAYYKAGNFALAVKYWQKTLELKPDFIEVLKNLAWLLTIKENSDIYDPAAAIEYAKRLCQLTGNQINALNALATAYAADGQLDKALETAQKALQLAHDSKQEELAQKIQEFINLYRSATPNSNAKNDLK